MRRRRKREGKEERSINATLRANRCNQRRARTGYICERRGPRLSQSPGEHRGYGSSGQLDSCKSRPCDELCSPSSVHLSVSNLAFPHHPKSDRGRKGLGVGHSPHFPPQWGTRKVSADSRTTLFVARETIGKSLGTTNLRRLSEACEAGWSVKLSQKVSAYGLRCAFLLDFMALRGGCCRQVVVETTERTALALIPRLLSFVVSSEISGLNLTPVLLLAVPQLILSSAAMFWYRNSKSTGSASSSVAGTSTVTFASTPSTLPYLYGTIIRGTGTVRYRTHHRYVGN